MTVLNALNPAHDGALESLAKHLDATMRWLCRAQDAAGEGVSRGYLLSPPHYGDGQWREAYPETTGYIIPTFFDYAALSGDPAYRDRAYRMAAWECDIQLECGAVQAGVIGTPAMPAVFDTGQVLFGWTRAYRETGDARFLQSAVRAADFLVAAQDEDGAWRRPAIPMVREGVNLYEARTAWGLADLGRLTGDIRYTEGAVRNLDFACERQRANGWFPSCCLSDDTQPLLHTLAYTMEGLLEAGALLNMSRYVAAAQRAADALLQRQRDDGRLAGRFDDEWREAVSWSCLTGDAQVSRVWLRLSEITGETRYVDAARRLNLHLLHIHDIEHHDPGVRGGVPGSHPISGPYLEYEYVNWAAKFLADALMLDMRVTGAPPEQRSNRSGSAIAVTPAAESALPREAFLEGLRDLGVRAGTVVFVHSAYDDMGSIRATPFDIATMLCQAAGDEGTVAMPTFPMRGSDQDHLDRGTVFDVRRTPSMSGIVTEAFRRMPGTCRSVHPTHSVAARGRHAQFITEAHAQSTTPFDEHSPFARLLADDVVVLRLGRFHAMTFRHLADHLFQDRIPHPIYRDQEIVASTIDASGAAGRVVTRAHNPSLRVDHSGVLAHMHQAGQVRVGVIGSLDVSLLNAREYMTAFDECLKRGIVRFELVPPPSP